MLSGKNVKVSKDGHLYVIVPFRHGTPGSVTMKPMPQEIAKQAKKLTSSTSIGRVGGKLITNWGSRLNEPEHGRRSKISTPDRPFAPYTWKTGPYHGMVKTGGKGHTQYMTFRVVSSKTPADSQAWAQPAIAPRPVAEASARQAMPKILEFIRDAIMAEAGG
jgi:hypothetical protein